MVAGPTAAEWWGGLGRVGDGWRGGGGTLLLVLTIDRTNGSRSAASREVVHRHLTFANVVEARATSLRPLLPLPFSKSKARANLPRSLPRSPLPSPPPRPPPHPPRSSRSSTPTQLPFP